MPTVQQLNQRHAECDVNRVEKLRALYEGGETFSKKIGEFLPARPAEPFPIYEMRKRESHYQNYIGPIIDYFSAMLFTSRPVPTARKQGAKANETDPGDYFNAFRGDCDRAGTDIDTFFQQQFTEAMVTKRAWHRIHQPKTGDVAPSNKAEFERRKLGDCWIQAIKTEDVFDWEVDDEGNLEWVITHSLKTRRLGPGDERVNVTETWEYITREEVETFQLEYRADKPPAPADTVPSVSVVAHNFGRVPVMCIDLKPGLWVASRLDSPQLAHFRASNAQDWGMSRTCYAMPVYKVKDPELFNTRMGAGYGITVEPDEDVSWTAPPGDHFIALEARIATHKDEIFRIGHQMALGVENNSAAVGRTAESKMHDSQVTRVVLIAFAKAVKEAMARTYDTISESRGDTFEWSIAGLDEFASTDLLSFLSALAMIDTLGGIPSRTARIQAWLKTTEALMPELDQKTKSTIREEIEAGTEEPKTDLEAKVEEMHALAATGLAGQSLSGKNPGAAQPGGAAKPTKAARSGVGRAVPATPAT